LLLLNCSSATGVRRSHNPPAMLSKQSGQPCYRRYQRIRRALMC
jgi:hypothetical protein